jgi:Phosphotransferase enzyme family
VLDDAIVSGWCARSLGAPVARVLFRSGHLSEVIGAELADGQPVVIKVRPFEPRIAACTEVQARLAAVGFPCPRPLAGPAMVGGFAVTAETCMPGGESQPLGHRAALSAALLARLVASAPAVGDVPSLAPSPPWTGWDHGGARLWPDLDDEGRDLNQWPGPDWVDRAAGQVRGRMSGRDEPPRIGHGDWELQNMRWTGDRILAVHDWDSVIAQPEVAIVGLAAAVWPAGGESGRPATVEQSDDFIAYYQAAAGARWTGARLQQAWAAGLWVRLFNAKKDAASGGGPNLDQLAGEIADRLALAGLNRLLPGEHGVHDDGVVHRRDAQPVPGQTEVSPVDPQFAIQVHLAIGAGDLRVQGRVAGTAADGEAAGDPDASVGWAYPLDGTYPVDGKSEVLVVGDIEEVSRTQVLVTSGVLRIDRFGDNGDDAADVTGRGYRAVPRDLAEDTMQRPQPPRVPGLQPDFGPGRVQHPGPGQRAVSQQRLQRWRSGWGHAAVRRRCHGASLMILVLKSKLFG